MKNYNSPPQVPGPGGWEEHDRKISIAAYQQRAETKRLTIKLLTFLGAVIFAALAWVIRWEITPISSGSGLGAAYMLNRWTGSLYYVRLDESTDVKPSK